MKLRSCVLLLQCSSINTFFVLMLSNRVKQVSSVIKKTTDRVKRQTLGKQSCNTLDSVEIFSIISLNQVTYHSTTRGGQVE